VPLLTEMSLRELERIVRLLRGCLVEMSHAARAPHLGSALSCVDILVAAYWGALQVAPDRSQDPHRDRFILSKGHAAAALYAVLAQRGFFPRELLATYGQPGSCLPEQMSPGCVPGVEAATGSLGHGLSLGAGMALASRIQGPPYRVWVVLGDGECNEGSVWEAAAFAAARQLTNLLAIVDCNRWQATGRTEETLTLRPLAEKWSAFGWRVTEVNGHDLGELRRAIGDWVETGQGPACIVARTIKGRGVSFMEDDNNWHYRIPTADEVRAAHLELGLL
jgi:transketolase